MTIKQKSRSVVILFCDIVGFSTHNDDDQFAYISELNNIISKELYKFRKNINALSTGDGVALLFFEWNKEKKDKLFKMMQALMDWSKENSVELRIGIHLGMIYQIKDINKHLNVCGNTINICQRIMDSANPRQVLFSDTAYGTLVGQKKAYKTTSSPLTLYYFDGPCKILVKHGQQLNVHIMHKGDAESYWNRDKPHDHYMHRKIISGKVPRTRFIVERLNKIKSKRPIEIYEQAALSTFSISTDPNAWKTNPNYSKTYFNLLTKQRKTIDRLAKKRDNQLKLIIWPDSLSVKSPRKRTGLRELIKWMEESKSYKNIDWVRVKYKGGNRLIVPNEFYIRAHYIGEPGYEASIIEERNREINRAVDNFRTVFRKAKHDGQTKESVIEELKKQLKSKYCGV